MSVVTSLVLIYDISDREVVSNLELGEYTGLQHLVSVTEAANAGAVGPSRAALAIGLAATAVKYLGDPEDLAGRIERAPWRRPECVLLLVRQQEEVRPSVWGFTGALYFGTVEVPRRFERLLPAVQS